MDWTVFDVIHLISWERKKQVTELHVSLVYNYQRFNTIHSIENNHQVEMKNKN